MANSHDAVAALLGGITGVPEWVVLFAGACPLVNFPRGDYEESNNMHLIIRDSVTRAEKSARRYCHHHLDVLRENVTASPIGPWLKVVFINAIDELHRIHGVLLTCSHHVDVADIFTWTARVCDD